MLHKFVINLQSFTFLLVPVSEEERKNVERGDNWFIMADIFKNSYNF